MKMKIKKGFSLLELTLVLGVGTIVAFMKFQDMKNEQESILASAVGQQMKQIGEAVNGYINIRYDKLSTLSNAAGTGTDPGPRTCSGSVCEITYQTLINEGLLPSAFTGTNANKSSYKIILKRDGTTPNYVINGLITTSTAWIEGGKTRYDLLGNAMQIAGIDSGMTRTTSNAFGYGGQWTETSANFNNITSAGQLAFRVGYNSALYSVYLRRDGTLPMTGDLNMGGRDINNLKNLSATGSATVAGDVSAKNLNATGNSKITGTVTAGYAIVQNSLTWGGNTKGTLDSFGNINAQSGSMNSLQVAQNINVGHQITSKFVTGDYVYANQEMQTLKFVITGGTAGQIFNYGTSYLDNIYTNPGGSINNNGTLYTGGNATFNGNIKAQKGLDAYGEIKATGNITSSGQVKGATLESTGRTTVGEFIQLNGQASVNSSCSPNGLQGRTPEGAILSCVNGLWSNSFSGEISSNTFNLGFTGTINLGVQKFCAIGSYRSDSEDDGQCQVYKSGANWYITTSQQSHVGCSAVCFK
ncbi:shufflon system plasmid conjugative transfer pilus tip adhesin PilV [Escherichia coli]|uniref:shufflon system plasmid conjugative transfer pilus tip adhesin PilV n=1 Tax=Escherichia coli TaxID=562 RepID=UPI0023AFA2A4|nr:shufflon system plasmid conjugative transfer pilus tip adhesin PilV [Escherichia coli]MDE7861085.1 shufflon system plasmid conjugative transfer pilus tip adhesin PilV [Escherichia coli]